MTNRVFYYEALLTLENDEYNDLYIKQITNASQLKITSQSFKNYDECVEAFNLFNKDLIKDIEISSSEEYKMAWESNPFLTKNSSSPSTSSQSKWLQNEIVKVYFFSETDYNKLLNPSVPANEDIYPLLKGSIFIQNTVNLAQNKLLH